MISFDCKRARGDFTLNAAFEAGEGVTALFGPSGSGKSTIIRLIAGLEKPDSGRITASGETLLDTDRGIDVPPERRRVGVVFQDSLLFPHLSVRANLVYGERLLPVAARRIALSSVTEVLAIGHLLDRRPETLSGGERQRVAIGRALMTSPRLLLMDEPLASLDRVLKREILPFIERLAAEFAMPVLYVSHSVPEVARLAAHVVLLRDGRVTASGLPEAMLQSVLDGSGGDGHAISVLSAIGKAVLSEHGLSILAHPAGEIVIAGDVPPGRAVRVFIRETDVALATEPVSRLSTRTRLSGRVEAIAPGGVAAVRVSVALDGGGTIAASVTRLAASELALTPGVVVTALVKAVALDADA
jgi:molybdate transport system ATP-binding protein